MAITMIKEQARKIINKLPKTATWDDLMHEIYVRKAILFIPFLATLLTACSSTKQVNELQSLKTRIAALEKSNRNNSVTINHLTNKVFNGQSETIHGKTYFPKAKIEETADYIIYYRKKVKNSFEDAVIVFKTNKHIFRKGWKVNAKHLTITANRINIDNGNIYE